MPRASTIQASFSSGEISPLSQGRIDDPRYKTALATCENYVPLLQGPKTRRPGSTFVMRNRYADQKSVLIPFSFSTGQNYVFEFSGSGYVRFFKDGAPILRTSSGSNISITSATNASPLSITGPIV